VHGILWLASESDGTRSIGIGLPATRRHGKKDSESYSAHLIVPLHSRPLTRAEKNFDVEIEAIGVARPKLRGKTSHDFLKESSKQIECSIVYTSVPSPAA
jgi:hypothetical protein